MVLLKEITSDEAETVSKENHSEIFQETTTLSEQLGQEGETTTGQPFSSETATAQGKPSQEDETAKEQASQEEETTKKPVKPRKKSQAFNMPRTAALKSLINRNKADSPLLRLPREVRNRIWKFVIGHRLLHIVRRSCSLDRFDPWPTWCPEMHWVTTCCLACSTEEEIFQKSTQLSDNRDLHPHDLCRQMIKSVRAYHNQSPDTPLHHLAEIQDHVLPVQVLRVCRQIHIEANPILWSTNTMSFHDRNHFRLWMSQRITAQKALITAQKALITGLHLDFSRQTWIIWELRASKNLGMIKSLSALRSLHLYIEDDCPPSNTAQAPDDARDIGRWWDQRQRSLDSSGSANYKVLPLKNVTVLLTDIKPPGPCGARWAGSREAWRLGERIKFAEAVRQRILA